MNLVAMAAQHLRLSPGGGIPKADGLVGRGRYQLSSVFGKHQLANPCGVSVELAHEPAGLGVPDAEGGIHVSATGNKHPAIGGEREGAQTSVVQHFGLPQLLPGGEIEALDVVTPGRLIRTRQIKTLVVGRQPGGAEKNGAIKKGGVAAFDRGSGHVHHRDFAEFVG